MSTGDNVTNSRRFLVGLDFGTTYSGISYVELSQAGQVRVDRVDTTAKVPTKVLASACSTTIGSSDKLLEWFKLGLLHPDQIPRELLSSRRFKQSTEDRQNEGIRAVQAVATYIRILLQDFLWNLQTRAPNASIQLTVTVPVVWPASARQGMDKAISASGILGGNVTLAPKFVAEPEAAALALLSNAINPEDAQAVIVCDCGGGTVDSVAYIISSVNPFRVKEVMPGESIFAGGCLLDDGFMELLKSKTQDSTSSQAFRALTERNFKDFADDHWEVPIKKDFSVDFNTKQIPLPLAWAGSQARRRRVGQGVDLTFTKEDIVSVFDPIVKKIEKLVKSQLSQVSDSVGYNVSYLIVAGGFGKNPYLQSRVKETVDRVSPTTKTYCYTNDDGWHAVSRGAVIHALQAHRQGISVEVESRIARADWGVCTGSGEPIEWLVRKNEPLWATQENRWPLSAEVLSVSFGKGGRAFEIGICRNIAPDEGKSPEHVCKLRWKTDDVGIKPDMSVDLRASLEIELTWDSAKMEFSLLYDGVKQSSVDFEHRWDF
ncbi:hypothetical protein IL306_014188 [Fusarium sp. DS 682]|nr:hypothetical protein IL306_014188 [Fusarium sp. DS 682]